MIQDSNNTSAVQHENYKVLLVDDDPVFHKDFRFEFKRAYLIEGALDEEKMWEWLNQPNEKIDVVLLDMKLDGQTLESGLNLIPKINAKYPNLPVIAVTADDNARTIVEAMKRGAKSFLPKNDLEYDYWSTQIAEAIQAARSKAVIEQSVQEIQRLNKRVKALTKGEAPNKYPFIGTSPRILEIKSKLERAAQRPERVVLLTGETGGGKEVAARYFHSSGPRKDKPFVAVNLSALPPSLLESALFGSVKGAYTGSQKDVLGYFHQANGGVLFLDEIGDVDANIQVMLLRFLEHRIIRPVGSEKDVELDIHIILATHKDLNAEVAAGRFRDDLRYRINTVLKIPPLRERMEDMLPIMAHYILEKFGLSVHECIEPAVISKMLEYPWPGNIRQLCSVIDGLIDCMEEGDKNRADIDCLEEAWGQAWAMPATAVENFGLTLPPSTIGEPSSQLPSKKAKMLADLKKIESLLAQGIYAKKEISEMLGYKGNDHMRSRIHTCYKNYPELFEQFPHIRKHYHVG